MLKEGGGKDENDHGYDLGEGRSVGVNTSGDRDDIRFDAEEIGSDASPASTDGLLSTSSSLTALRPASASEGEVSLLGTSGEGDEPLSLARMCKLCSFIVGWSATWTFLLVVAIPKQVLDIVGDDHKGFALGKLMVWGGTVSLSLPPLIGYCSDRFQGFSGRYSWMLPKGRRRPFILVGTITFSLNLWVLGACKTMPSMTFFWMTAQLFSNVASACFMGLLPDAVPPSQLGSASGVMGGLTAFGQLVGSTMGLFVDGVGIPGCYKILALLNFACMIPTVFLFSERRRAARGGPHLSSAPNGSGCSATVKHIIGELISPLSYSDFRWVFLTRLLVNMGIYSVQEFLQYYVKDLIPVEGWTPTKEVSVIFIPLLLSGVFTAIVCGKLSDRWGKRKFFVYVSGAGMSGVSFVLMFNRSFFITMIMALIFGASFGAFGAVDMALAIDCLPDKSGSAAKDLGVWHSAMVLPQLIATPIAGAILDHLKATSGVGTAYAAVFALAASYLLLGTAFVRYIRGVE